MTRLLRILFWGCFSFFAILSLRGVLLSFFDGHDSLLFIEQARRLADPHFFSHNIQVTRPRGLVMLIAIYDFFIHSVTGRFPSMVEYHLFSWMIAIAFILVWRSTIRLFFDDATASLTGILLCANYLVFSHASMMLSDVLTGLCWGIVSGGYFLFTKGSFSSNARRIWCSVAIGFAAGVLALCKYQYFFLFPTLLIISYAAGKWLPRLEDRDQFKRIPYGEILLSYVLTVDLGQRLTGELGVGFWYTVKLYASFLKPHAAIFLPPTSPLMYLRDFYYAYGFGLCLIVVSAAVISFRRRDRRMGKLSIVGLLWIGVNGLYLLFNQVLVHREPRYLLPLLPPLIAIAVTPLAYLIRDSSRTSRTVWSVLFCLSLLFPLREQIKWTRQLEGRAAAFRKANYGQFWSYLNSKENGKCDAILACQTELQAPHYLYYLPDLDSRVSYCAGKPSDYKRLLSNRPRAGLCYVLAPSRTGNEFGNLVRVEKTLTVGMNQAQADRWLDSAKTTYPSASVDCERDDNNNFSCFSEREFFSEIPSASPRLSQN